MKVLEVYPSRSVLWEVADGPAEWIGMTVPWDLKQEGDYAIVLFAHEGWREPVKFMYHCSTVGDVPGEPEATPRSSLAA